MPRYKVDLVITMKVTAGNPDEAAKFAKEDLMHELQANVRMKIHNVHVVEETNNNS